MPPVNQLFTIMSTDRSTWIWDDLPQDNKFVSTLYVVYVGYKYWHTINRDIVQSNSKGYKGLQVNYNYKHFI